MLTCMNVSEGRGPKATKAGLLKMPISVMMSRTIPSQPHMRHEIHRRSTKKRWRKLGGTQSALRDDGSCTGQPHAERSADTDADESTI